MVRWAFVWFALAGCNSSAPSSELRGTQHSSNAAAVKGAPENVRPLDLGSASTPIMMDAGAVEVSSVTSANIVAIPLPVSAPIDNPAPVFSVSQRVASLSAAAASIGIFKISSFSYRQIETEPSIVTDIVCSPGQSFKGTIPTQFTHPGGKFPDGRFVTVLTVPQLATDQTYLGFFDENGALQAAFISTDDGTSITYQGQVTATNSLEFQ